MVQLRLKNKGPLFNGSIKLMTCNIYKTKSFRWGVLRRGRGKLR